ncbi:efflux RND transporter periplasmic adaptor subunit [bacterium]|nr:efflux RND transporter periplasmic adaptor subunit [bacterium]
MPKETTDFFSEPWLLLLYFSFLAWSCYLGNNCDGLWAVIAYAPNDRQQEINAPVDGRIQKWHVFEGTKVKAGDAIVDLTDNDPEILDRLRLERDAGQKGQVQRSWLFKLQSSTSSDSKYSLKKA